jgi:catalase
MTTTVSPQKAKLYEELVNVLNAIFGAHPGFRAAHAKGIVCEGTFAPAPGAASLSRASHLQQATVPAIIRFSNSTGVPNIPDADLNATPKGMAIRFHTPSGETDIVAHSANGFPVATAEEFLEFLRAVLASGPDAPHPTPIEKFVGTHPNALRFVQLPKPTPASFAQTSYFALHAFGFVNRQGQRRFGRYFIRSVESEQYLSADEAAKKSPNFLFEELAQRLARGSAQFRIFAQLANPDDPTHDASTVWPDDREHLELGTLSIERIRSDSDAAQRRLIFDPVRLIDGIELGDDLLPKDRSGVYSVSYSRRNPV